MAAAVMFLLICAVLSACAECADNEVATCCDKKGKNIAALGFAKEALLKAKDLYPNCPGDEKTDEKGATECSKRVRSLGYLDVALKLVTEAAVNYPKCPVGEVYPQPLDCSQVMENGMLESGVYTVWREDAGSDAFPRRREPMQVFCDMDTEGGGWTLIQKRSNFTQEEDFYRNWEDYKHGFGDISKNFWLGNDNIFALTNQLSYAVRIDVKDVDGHAKYALYRRFSIEDEKSGYALSVSNYTGSAGDCLTYLNDMKFSTKDRRNDKNGGSVPCTETRRSGWWFNTCSLVELVDCNPNGVYLPGQKDDFKSNYWWYWTTGGEGMHTIEIKVKPAEKIEC